MKKNHTLRNKLNVVLLVCIGLLVLYFALKDNFEVIVHEILSIHIGWLLLALTFIFLYWFLRALVMRACITHFKKEYRLKQAMKLTMATQFFNAITPFSSGGQPFQIYMLNKNGIRPAQGTNIVVSEFITYQIALVLLGSIAVIANFFGNYFPDNALLSNLVTIGFIINFGVIVFLLAISFTKRFNKWLVLLGIKFLSKIKIVKNKETTVKKWDNHLNSFHEGAKIILRDKKLFFKMIIYNFLGLVALYLIPWAIFSGAGISINPLMCIITSAYVMLVGAFVPIPGGTGGLEFSFMAFFGNFVTGGVLNAVMLLWRFISYYLGMIVGSFAVSAEKEVKK